MTGLSLSLDLTLKPVGGGGGVVERLRPIALTKAVANEYNSGNGLAAPQVGATTHHVCYELLTDDSFQVWYAHHGATAGQGEWATAGDATARCSVMWIDDSGAVHITQLTTQNGNEDVLATSGGWFKFYGKGNNVKPKAGSHFWLWFYGVFSSYGYCSHARADYANGDALQYGSSIPDLTGTSTFYGNTWIGGGDYYGPSFIGGHATRPTYSNDSDSREAGVLVSGVISDVPDTLYGAVGQINRLLTPFMAGIDISVPGASAQEMADPTKTVNRDILISMTDMRYCGNGGNDTIFIGRTAAQVAADEATRLAHLNIDTRYKTIDPVVTSNTVNTVYNAGRDPERRALNTALRATPKVFDGALVLESSGAPGTYAGGAAKTIDGTHETATANKEAITGAAYDVETNTGAAAMSAGVQYPSGALYQSLDFSGWSVQQAAIDAINKVYSPEHKMTSRVLKEDGTASASHLTVVQQTIALASTTKKITCFAKRQVGSRNVQIQVQQNGGSYASSRVQCDLSSGAMTVIEQGAGTITGQTATLMDDGSWKIEWNCAFGSGHPASSFLYVKMAQAAFVDTYDGDNTSSLAIWGFDIR